MDTGNTEDDLNQSNEDTMLTTSDIGILETFDRFVRSKVYEKWNPLNPSTWVLSKEQMKECVREYELYVGEIKPEFIRRVRTMVESQVKERKTDFDKTLYTSVKYGIYAFLGFGLISAGLGAFIGSRSSAAKKEEKP